MVAFEALVAWVAVVVETLGVNEGKKPIDEEPERQLWARKSCESAARERGTARGKGKAGPGSKLLRYVVCGRGSTWWGDML